MKRNILANYVSQIYVTLIGIVMVPMYVRYMGAEAYGLVGFYAMLQAWFQLLDMGLTPTMARETSRFAGGAGDPLRLRRLLRTLEGVFFGIALLGAITIMLAAGPIATGWLTVQHLDLAEVRRAVMLMGLVIALRWIGGLYRGSITGFERLVWLSGLNISAATARFVLVVPVFIYLGTSPTIFFSYQFLIAVVEVFALFLKSYRLMPSVDSVGPTRWDWGPLRAVLKFSLSIAFTGSVWVLVTQTDKLVLSKLLPLSQYAYFSLAVLVASGVSVISGPISGALIPRLTRLSAEADEGGLIALYRNATQLVALIAIPASCVLAVFPHEVLWAWTGNAAIASDAAPVLALYAFGNGILALAAFPYYLQYAKGDLKLHLVGNVIFVILLIPALVWATLHYGAVGAGFAWVTANALYFLLWVPRVHARFAPGLHLRWLMADILGIAACTWAVGLVIKYFIIWPNTRLSMAIAIALVSVVVLIAGVIGAPVARGRLFSPIVRLIYSQKLHEHVK